LIVAFFLFLSAWLDYFPFIALVIQVYTFILESFAFYFTETILKCHYLLKLLVGVKIGRRFNFFCTDMGV
jgi:hypothetical protein